MTKQEGQITNSLIVVSNVDNVSADNAQNSKVETTLTLDQRVKKLVDRIPLWKQALQISPYDYEGRYNYSDLDAGRGNFWAIKRKNGLVPKPASNRLLPENAIEVEYDFTDTHFELTMRTHGSLFHDPVENTNIKFMHIELRPSWEKFFSQEKADINAKSLRILASWDIPLRSVPRFREITYLIVPESNIVTRKPITEDDYPMATDEPMTEDQAELLFTFIDAVLLGNNTPRITPESARRLPPPASDSTN